jgi:two-component system, cell cycle response regulator
MVVNAPPLRFTLGRRLLGAAALAGLIVHAIYAVGDLDALDDVVGNGVYNALILAAALSCIARAAAVPVERWAWGVMGVGLLSWSAADIYASVAYGGETPALSAADPLYLAFYPAAYIALVLLVRDRMTRLPSGVWLDGVIAALATAALGAAVLQASIAEATNADGVAIAVNLAYPLGDIVLFGVVVGVIALTGWRPEPAWVLLAASLAIGVAADAIYLERVARDSYSQGTLLDTLWPLSVLLIACAAWAPARKRVALTLEGWRLVVAPSLFSLLSLGIVALSLSGTPSRPALALAVACLVATIARMALAQRDTLRSMGGLRQASLTDPLTGLLNRRALTQQLEAPRDEPLLVAILDLDGFKGFNDRFGHVRGDELLVTLARRLTDAVGPDRAFRLGGDEFCVLLPGVNVVEGTQLPEAANAALTVELDGACVSSSMGATIAEPGEGDVGGILHRADQAMYAQKQTRRLVSALAGLLDAFYVRRPELRVRNAHVAHVSRAVGVTLGMGDVTMRRMERAVELRDLGLLAVPDHLLKDAGALALGCETAALMIGATTPDLEDVAGVIRACGERYDGRGPAGLSGDTIPLESRVIAVADAFVETRENGCSPTDALTTLKAAARADLDPNLVHALEQTLSVDRTTFETANG